MAGAYTLAIGVRASTDKLRKDLGGVSKLFGGLQSKIAKIGAAVGVAFSAGAVIAGIRSTATALDDVAKTANKLGASADAFIMLEHASGLAGVSTEELADAMRKNLDVIGSATDAGKETEGVFKSIGISARDLANMSLEQRMTAIAGALEQIKNPADRVRIAVDLFGRAGANLLPLFSQGAAGLQAAMKEAQLLGLTIGDGAGKVEAANDALSRLWQVGVGVFRQLTVALAPFIEQFATALLPTVVALGRAFVSTFTGAFNSASVVVPVIGGINASLASMFNVLTGIHGLWLIVRSAIAKLFSWLEAGIAKVLKLLPKSFGMGDIADAADQLAQDFADSAADSWQLGTEKLSDALNGRPGEKFLDDVRAIRAEFEALKLPAMDASQAPSSALASSKARQFPESLMRGTVEAASRALKLEFGDKSDEVPKAQLREQQETNSLLAKLESRGIVLAPANM